MVRKQKHYYVYERNKARIMSAAIHALFLLLIIFGLPDFMLPKPPEEPVAISVEILPVTGITNIKPSEPEEKKETKQEEKETQKTPAPPPPPAPAKSVAQVLPPEPAPNVKTKNNPQPKKEEKKPEPKKEEEKKPEKEKPNDQDFQKLLNDLKKADAKQAQQANKNAAKSAPPAPKAVSTQYNPTLPLSMSETDAIMSQIAKCWSPPIGAKDAPNLIPILDAEYNNDGSLKDVTIADEIKSRYNSDSFFRAAADSAIRATKQCSPLKGLPPEKYETWRALELHFDPRFLLN